MIFERVKSEGIAHNSYFVASGGLAAVIDPRRDADIYLKLSRRHAARIRYVLETHRNEDYLIGSNELSHFTGAQVYHGPGLDWGYGETLKDGQEIDLGSVRLTAIHTPGHTDESMTYVLTDLSTGEEPVIVFTGDTLFIGEVGRVDLYGSRETPRLAAAMYDSIFNRILPLGDKVIICPAHGAGSVCGADIADRDESTLGLEKAENPTLKMSRDEFIKYKVREAIPSPPYFSRMESLNLNGPPLLQHLPEPNPLSPDDFQERVRQGGIAVDTREPAAFGGAHIKGSYSIWLEGLPIFAGWVLPQERPLLLVSDNERHLDSAIRYLVRAGYENIEGYLRNGIERWYNAGLPIERLPTISVHELKKKLDSGEPMTLLDVREPSDWASGHIPGAINIYVGELEGRLSEMPADRNIIVYCTVGRRASLAASILLKAGFTGVSNVLGSMKAWFAAGYPIEEGA